LIETEARKRGAKWNSDNRKLSVSIAGLFWQENPNYVHDEPCAPVKFDSSRETTAQHYFGKLRRDPDDGLACPKIFLAGRDVARLQTPWPAYARHSQGSKRNNSLHLPKNRPAHPALRRTRSSNGRSDALAGGTNQLHYTVSASANSTVELVTELPFKLQRIRKIKSLWLLGANFRWRYNVCFAACAGMPENVLEFQTQKPYEPRGDQPAQSSRFPAAWMGGDNIRCSSASPVPAKRLPWRGSFRPRIALPSFSAHNKTLAAQLYHEFKNFFPENAVDIFVSYYDFYQPKPTPAADVYIEKRIHHQRRAR